MGSAFAEWYGMGSAFVGYVKKRQDEAARSFAVELALAALGEQRNPSFRAECERIIAGASTADVAQFIRDISPANPEAFYDKA